MGKLAGRLAAVALMGALAAPTAFADEGTTSPTTVNEGMKAKTEKAPAPAKKKVEKAHKKAAKEAPAKPAEKPAEKPAQK